VACEVIAKAMSVLLSCLYHPFDFANVALPAASRQRMTQPTCSMRSC
jgi:hypothetical protein